MTWLVYSLLSALLYGIWAFLGKLATHYIDPRSVLLFQFIGMALVSLGVYAHMGFKVQTDPRGVAYALAVGISAAFALLCFIKAMTTGKTGPVSVIAALYPVVAILLALLLLQESLSTRQWIGLGGALISIALLASE